LKLGVEKLYTTIFTSFNVNKDSSSGSFASGVGIGSIIPIGRILFFNPELNWLWPFYFDKHNDNRAGNTLASLVPSFGFRFGRHLSVTAGPSFTRVYNWGRWSSRDSVMPDPIFSLYSHDINERNRIVIGARAAVRMRF